MKKIIILLLILVSNVYSYAQDRYASRMTQDGTIYFIMPKKLSKLHGIKHFDYDVTLLSWSDSVTINFTFQSEIMGLPTDFSIKSCNSYFKSNNYTLLFQDIKKKGFEIRVTSKFSSEDFKEIINCEESPTFNFFQSKKEESAAYSEGAWKKDRRKLIDIYNIYQYSKSK